jgi:CysZ protein
MLRALSRAVAQLFDSATFGILAVSVAGAAAVSVALAAGTDLLVTRLTLFRVHWLDWLAHLAVGIGSALLAVALFGAVAAMIAGLFVDRVARAVERRYYSGLPPARSSGVGEQLIGGLSYLIAALVLNLLALPLYLFWGANAVIFLGLNGYLLGREYFELVALRRVDRRTARLLWGAHRIKLILCGAIIAAFSFVPLANLLTPVLATAFMLHIFQDLTAFEEACRGRYFGDTPGRSPPPTLRKT